MSARRDHIAHVLRVELDISDDDWRSAEARRLAEAIERDVDWAEADR